MSPSPEHKPVRTPASALFLTKQRGRRCTLLFPGRTCALVSKGLVLSWRHSVPLALPSPRRQACLPCRPVEFKNAGYTSLNTTVCTDSGAPVGSDGICAHGPCACLPSLPFGTATGLCGKDTIFIPTCGLLIVSFSQLLPTADARAGYTETSVRDRLSEPRRFEPGTEGSQAELPGSGSRKTTGDDGGAAKISEQR